MHLNEAWEKVKQFHKKFQQPWSETPVNMPKRRRIVRCIWMREEIEEFLCAKTLVDQTDAMMDLLFFCIGTLVEMGVRPEKVFLAVLKANMAKLWDDGKPHFRDGDNKIMKPEGWEPPEAEIEKILQQYTRRYERKLWNS
jgi:predicted HAD superfamily Cof-like phosphohydrolase